MIRFIYSIFNYNLISRSNIVTIQKLLGHSSVVTYEKYVEVNIENVKLNIDKVWNFRF